MQTRSVVEVVTVRLLMAMMLGALIALMGGLFLGEYEFDEWLPIVSGALLGLIVAEIVVSVGKHRSLALGVVVATWSVAAVILAGLRDASADEPVKWGVYLSASLAAVAAFARASEWSLRRKPRRRPKDDSNRRPDGAAPVADDAEIDQDSAPWVPDDPEMAPAPAAGEYIERERGGRAREYAEPERRPDPEETSPWAPVRPRPRDRADVSSPQPPPNVRLRVRSPRR